MEVMSKSLAEKINEVRDEERKKAEETTKKQALEHQAALNKAMQDKDLAFKQVEEKHEAAIKAKNLTLKQAEDKH